MHVNLVLFKKDGTQKLFPLSSNITVIGRRHDCDLRIPLTPVSRRHCKLSKNNRIINIKDLGSRNGTFLNGKRIKEASITAGDYIGVGSLTFLLQVDGKPEEVVPPAQINQEESSRAAETEETQELEVPVNEASGSFPELDLSDSFMKELEKL
jgi:pSer/pThr/pTyr-binding forkhead associated (FHA) protein